MEPCTLCKSRASASVFPGPGDEEGLWPRNGRRLFEPRDSSALSGRGPAAGTVFPRGKDLGNLGFPGDFPHRTGALCATETGPPEPTTTPLKAASASGKQFAFPAGTRRTCRPYFHKAGLAQ